MHVGDEAPVFALKGTSGPGLDLAAIRGKKRAALYFYPADRTPGCRVQLAAVRDEIEALRALDTEPFGVNEADAASHNEFIAEQNLPFDLLIDEGLQVARAYDALKDEGNRINRTVVVIGKNGKILFWAHGAPPPEEIISAIVAAEDEG